MKCSPYYEGVINSNMCIRHSKSVQWWYTWWYCIIIILNLDSSAPGNRMDESAIWENIAWQQENHEAKPSAI